MVTPSILSSNFACGFSAVGLQLSATFTVRQSDVTAPGLSVPEDAVELQVHPECLQYLGFDVTPDNSAYSEILGTDKRIAIALIKASFSELMDDLAGGEIPVGDDAFSLDSLMGFHFQVNPYTTGLWTDYNILSILQMLHPGAKRAISKLFSQKHKGSSAISNLLSMGKLSKPKCDRLLWIAQVVDHLEVLKALKNKVDGDIANKDYGKLIEDNGIKSLGSVLQDGYTQKDARRDIYIIYVMLKVIESGIQPFVSVAKKKIASYGGPDSVEGILSWDYEGEDETLRNDALLLLKRL